MHGTDSNVESLLEENADKEPVFIKKTSADRTCDRLVNAARKYRDRQIEDYEERLAVYEAAQAKDEPDQAPASATAESAETRGEDEEHAEPQGLLYPDKLRILFIDDEENWIEIMDVVFQALDPTQFETDSANSAKEAKEKIESGSFDLIISDILMPEADLIEEDLENAPFLILHSAHDFFTARRLAGDALFSKAISHLTKPWDFAEMSNLITECRQWQIEEYEQRLIEQRGGPNKPGRLRILFIDDDPGFLKRVETQLKGRMSSREYELVFIDSIDVHIEDHIPDTKDIIKDFDVVVCDIKIVNFVSIEDELAKAKFLILESGDRAEFAEKEVGSELFGHARQYIRKSNSFSDELLPILQKARQEQIESYEEELSQWEAEQKRRESGWVAPSGKKTVFVIDNVGSVAEDLQKFLADELGLDDHEVVKIDREWELERALAKSSPDIVITDTRIRDKKLEGWIDIHAIISAVRQKNPDAKIVIASDDADVLSTDDFAGYNVLGIVEKPYHFYDVLDVINGEYDLKVQIAQERFRIEEAARVASSIQPAHTREAPGLVMVWSGYAAPQFQRSVQTEIEKECAGKPYQVHFVNNIEGLVGYACAQAKNEDVVTILPYNAPLTRAQRRKLEKAKARVIFMDFNEGVTPQISDIVELSTIVFTGIAYLCNDNNAFMRFYQLLTDSDEAPGVTLEALKRDPTLLKFILHPIKIPDKRELRRLNERMTELLRAV